MFKVKAVSLCVSAGLFLMLAGSCVLAEDVNAGLRRALVATGGEAGSPRREAGAKKTSPDPFEQNERLGRGVNLGNALDAPNEGEWGVTLKEEYFKIIKDAGFDSVRIPCRWSAHASNQPPYTIDKPFMDRVSWAIDNAIKNDLYVMLNIHHYRELTDDPNEYHTSRYLALWKQIAEHYKDYPDSVLFELLNEPDDALTAELWNALLKKALPIVRESNPHRTIVIDPAEDAVIDLLDKLEIPEDDHNIIVSVHYYFPLEFTHQGAEWMGERSKVWMGTTWTGTDEQKQAIIDAFDKAVAWGKEHNRPINLGEFGAYVKADKDQRVLWTTFITESARKRGFSYLYWEFCHENFGVYDQKTNQWKDYLLNALIPPEK